MIGFEKVAILVERKDHEKLIACGKNNGELSEFVFRAIDTFRDHQTPLTAERIHDPVYLYTFVRRKDIDWVAGILRNPAYSVGDIIGMLVRRQLHTQSAQ